MKSLLLKFLLLLSINPTISHTDTVCAAPPYKKLVLEGGGVKGIAYGGCIAALAEAGLLSEINGIAGSSAGSQAAVMVAAGYTGQEIISELLDLDFTMFLSDGSWNPISDVNEFLKTYGWFSGETVTGELDKKLQRKTNLTNTTMAQLYKHTGKELRVTAVDVITKKLVYIDHISFPDMPVAQAVRASSSIPYFFRPVRYNNYLLVDGGCIRNLPHDAFPAVGVEGGGSMLALSMRGEPEESVVENIVDFSSALAETVLFGPSSANGLPPLDDDEAIDVIQVDYGDVSVVDFYLSDVAKVELLERGYNSVNDRLLKCNHPGAKPGLPDWLTRLKLKTLSEEAMAKLETQLQPPADYSKHFNNLYSTLETYATQYKECIDENGVAYGSCGVKVFREGSLFEMLGELWAVVRNDRGLLSLFVLLLAANALIITLAVIGFGSYFGKKKKKIA